MFTEMPVLIKHFHVNIVCVYQKRMLCVMFTCIGSHTCFFTIDLPTYSTKEIMYERLNYAITCCSSIDGDGTVNDAPNADELIFEDNFD